MNRFVLFALCFTALVIADPVTVYIDPAGVDSETCTQATPCKTIKQAYSRSTDGDTISMAPGVYNGPGNTGLTFSSKRFLVGPGGATRTQILCANDIAITISGAANWTVNGVMFQGCSTAINFSSYDYTTPWRFVDCFFRTNQVAIRLPYGALHVSGTTFSGNTVAIDARASLPRPTPDYPCNRRFTSNLILDVVDCSFSAQREKNIHVYGTTSQSSGGYCGSRNPNYRSVAPKVTLSGSFVGKRSNVQGLAFGSSTTVSMTGVSFSKYTDQSALVATDGATVSMTDATFDTFQGASAIALDGAGAFTWNGGHCNNAQGASMGGCVSAHNTKVTIRGVSFSDNNATMKGGSIYADRSPLELIQASFENSLSTVAGGAIYASANSNFADVNFTKCTSGEGGAIAYIVQSGDVSMGLSQGVFYQNEATMGGGILARNNGTGLVRFSITDYAMKTSRGDNGAAFACEDTTFDVFHTSFSGRGRGPLTACSDCEFFETDNSFSTAIGNKGPCFDDSRRRRSKLRIN